MPDSSGKFKEIVEGMPLKFILENKLFKSYDGEF